MNGNWKSNWKVMESNGNGKGKANGSGNWKSNWKVMERVNEW